jgi:hypothetical protein
MWTNDALEKTMDAIKEGHTIPPRRASSSWNIPMNSIFKPPEWKNWILKDGVRRCVYKIRCKSD